MFNVLNFNTLQAQVSGFEAKTYISGSDTLLYRILYPENFKPGKKYPLVLFLHGAGERGNDNKKQLVHGSSLFLREDIRKNHPAIVIFPQCPQSSYWSNVRFEYDSAGHRKFVYTKGEAPTSAMKALMSFVEDLTSQRYIDQQRMYLGGLSMGGMGTFELLSRMPDTFVAAFPICGGGHTATVSAYASNTALWIFHGEEDAVVPADFSREMYQALKTAGAEVALTLYPGVNHNSWDNAFAEPDLLPWLFKYKKKKK
ncbi:MAG: prolyl oligopeptidase family serine peptidase [Cyclobacteriaceae bacterium]|nr:prolyl oligopeptidase family serine peptidase [Cyclobacteriaceae bacterium]